MASIEKRVRNGRLRWYLRYRTPDGAQRTETFDRKADAETRLVVVEGSKLAGDWVDPRLAAITVGEWADKWLAGMPNWAASTRERAEGNVRTHIKPRWGKTKLAGVRHEDVQEGLAGLAQGPATVR
jgi:hypothetical protein